MPTTKCGFEDVPGGHSGSDLLVAHGPTILVNIGFDPQYRSGRGQTPAAGVLDLRALIDTGASESCIDSRLAAELRLPIVDRLPISGVHGRQEVNIHVAQVHLPALAVTILGRFAGVHLNDGGQQHLALLGRTFLSHHQMSYDGLTGAVTLVRP
jgi:predicted aspartyl protease